MIPMFEYLTFVCEQPHLQEMLTKAGEARWRLHTCDPLLPAPGGSGLVMILVVLDRIKPDPQEDEDETEEATPEGLEVKG